MLIGEVIVGLYILYNSLRRLKCPEATNVQSHRTLKQGNIAITNVYCVSFIYLLNIGIP